MSSIIFLVICYLFFVAMFVTMELVFSSIKKKTNKRHEQELTKIYAEGIANIKEIRQDIYESVSAFRYLLSKEDALLENWFRNHKDFEITKTVAGFVLHGIKPGNTNKDIVIPYGVTIINDYACSSSSLTSVTIPDSVITIGLNAFSLNYLTSVTIPNSVTTINPGAFYENELRTVSLSESILKIGSRAFAENHVKEVEVPRSVAFLGDDVFDEYTIVHRR